MALDRNQTFRAVKLVCKKSIMETYSFALKEYNVSPLNDVTGWKTLVNSLDYTHIVEAADQLRS